MKIKYLIGIGTIIGALYLLSPLAQNHTTNLYKVKQKEINQREIVSIPITKPKKINSNVLNLENRIIIKSERGLEKKDEIYGTIDQPKEELYKNLIEKCNSNCLYYPDQDGNIRVVEGVEKIYDQELNCVGTFNGLEGWVLLGEDGKIEAFGKNKLSNMKPEELLIYGECSE